MGVDTVTRPVLGEKQDSSGNLEILPGIGRLGNFSGKYDIVQGHFRKKQDIKQNLNFDRVNNRKDLPNFPGGHVALLKQRGMKKTKLRRYFFVHSAMKPLLPFFLGCKQEKARGYKF